MDDSIVFRSAIRQAIEGQEGIQVVGTAIHGRQAVEKLEVDPSIDALILDLEMPVLDGIGTIKAIRERGWPAKIIVFSAHSQAGAEKTMEALTAGAQDFVPKVGGEDNPDGGIEGLKKTLVPKLLQFKDHKIDVKFEQPKEIDTTKIENFRPDVIHMGSSTGGPEALKKFFSSWTVKPGVPVLLTQHMPPLFTRQLAALLDRVCPALSVKEAEHGEVILVDHVYVAPGDFHMEVVELGGSKKIVLNQNEKVNSVRPAVDVMIDSSAKHFPKSLNVILTGMGEDGMRSCKKLKAAGNPILIQDEESCVVFGMPGAIARERLEDYVGNLDQLVNLLNKRWK